MAHRPVRFGQNSGLHGMEFKALTGTEILIQIGGRDDYDEGHAPRYALRSSLDEQFRELMDITTYQGAYHAFDRIEVPVTIENSFSHHGYGGGVDIIPDPEATENGRQNAARFFLIWL